MKIDRKLKTRLKALLTKKIKEGERGQVLIETPYKLARSEEQNFFREYPEFKKYQVEFIINKELIGGYVIKHASQIIDASVKTKIDDLVSQIMI